MLRSIEGPGALIAPAILSPADRLPGAEGPPPRGMVPGGRVCGGNVRLGAVAAAVRLQLGLAAPVLLPGDAAAQACAEPGVHGGAGRRLSRRRPSFDRAPSARPARGPALHRRRLRGGFSRPTRTPPTGRACSGSGAPVAPAGSGLSPGWWQASGRSAAARERRAAVRFARGGVPPGGRRACGCRSGPARWRVPQSCGPGGRAARAQIARGPGSLVLRCFGCCQTRPGCGCGPALARQEIPEARRRPPRALPPWPGPAPGSGAAASSAAGLPSARAGSTSRRPGAGPRAPPDAAPPAAAARS